MRLVIESTEDLLMVESNGPLPVRLWRGRSETGEACFVYVAGVAVPSGSPLNDEMVHDLDEVPVLTEMADPLPPEMEPAPAGICLAAEDPPAARAAHLARTIDPSLAWLARREGVGPVLDALASLYLDWAVRHCGLAQAERFLDAMRQSLPQVAAAQADPRLDAPARGRA